MGCPRTLEAQRGSARKRGARNIFLAAAFATLAAPLSEAGAEDLGFAGAWRLFFTQTKNHDLCGMSASYNGGTELYLRVSAVDLSSSVSLYNKDWRSIRNDDLYELSAQFSGQRSARFRTANAVGENRNGEIGLHFQADGEFLKNFKRKNAVAYFLRDGRRLVSLSLKDTTKGMNGLVKCIESRLRDERKDPFKGLEGEPSPDGGASRVSDSSQDI